MAVTPPITVRRMRSWNLPIWDFTLAHTFSSHIVHLTMPSSHDTSLKHLRSQHHMHYFSFKFASGFVDLCEDWLSSGCAMSWPAAVSVTLDLGYCRCHRTSYLSLKTPKACFLTEQIQIQIQIKIQIQMQIPTRLHCFRDRSWRR